MELAVAGETVAARLANGTIALWGWTGMAALGDGSVHDAHTPTPIAGLAGAVELAVGNGLCVRLQDASVRCSGGNYFGLGLVPPAPDAPQLVASLSNVTNLAASLDHRCAILRGGSVKCWGINTFGELGDGTVVTKSEPVDVRGLTDIVEITVGSGSHTCARRANGAIMCWGRNLYGALGDGTKDDRSEATLTHLGALR